MRATIPLLVLLSGPAMAHERHEIHCPEPVALDGDSLRCGNERLRLVGFDCPEIHRAKCPEEKRLGIKAKDRLAELLKTRPFRIVRSPKGKDRYRRTLALAYIDGENVGSILIREGLGRMLLWEHGERRRIWCE